MRSPGRTPNASSTRAGKVTCRFEVNAYEHAVLCLPYTIARMVRVHVTAMLPSRCHTYRYSSPRQGSSGSGEYHGYPLEPFAAGKRSGVNVRFRFGWVDAGPSPDKVSQSTMAALSVEAGGSTVTSVLDRTNRIYSDAVVVPLFSVAEWLITNWWYLWYEIEDTGQQRPEFESRHNLAFAGDGFVLPSLTVTPTSRLRRGVPRTGRGATPATSQSLGGTGASGRSDRGVRRIEPFDSPPDRESRPGDAHRLLTGPTALTRPGVIRDGAPRSHALIRLQSIAKAPAGRNCLLSASSWR